MLPRTTQSPYVNAEIGVNHNADFDLAKKLASAATSCGVDVVKSWKRNPGNGLPAGIFGMRLDNPDFTAHCHFL